MITGYLLAHNHSALLLDGVRLFIGYFGFYGSRNCDSREFISLENLTDVSANEKDGRVDFFSGSMGSVKTDRQRQV